MRSAEYAGGALMFTLTLLLTLSAGPAKADDLRARQLHDKAAAAFEARRYDEAAETWKEAFRVSSRPLFLFNVGQALKKSAEGDARAERLEQARAAYQDYLDASSGNEPERVDALRALLDIDRELATARAAPKVEPTPQPKLEPSPTVLPPGPVATPAEVAPLTTSPPWWRHPAFWISAAVVVAAGSTAGVVLATRCRADLGCLDAR